MSWEVLQGDCRPKLASMRGKVALVLCDSPYGISHPCNFVERGRSKDFGKNYADVFEDDQPFDPAPILELDVPTVLWGANHFADKLPSSGGWLVWDKRTKNDVGVNDQADGELAWTNCVKGVRIFRHMWNGYWRDSERGQSFHPTQKPVALMRWVLGLPWLPKTGLVLDPYCGSGPVGVAAVEAGMDYLGFDVVPDYCEIARRRISEAVPLWAPEPKAIVSPPELFGKL